MASTGEAIRLLREARKLTLHDLAGRAATSPSYLSRVERGEREPSERWVRVVMAALRAEMTEKAS